jgi:hypothetical protein
MTFALITEFSSIRCLRPANGTIEWQHDVRHLLKQIWGQTDRSQAPNTKFAVSGKLNVKA